jgi:diguanylate cyclase (GGDEF)-like protein
VRQRTGQQEWGLVQELLHNHRAMLQVLTFLLVLALSTAGYTTFVAQARLERYIAMAYNARNVQISMLDQSAAIRGWIATGESSFLTTFREARADGNAALDDLVGQVEGDDTPGLTNAVLRTAVARKAWFDWAAAAVAEDPTDNGTDHEVVASLLHQGRGLFEKYRQADSVSTGLLVARRDSALVASRTALLVGVAVFVLVLIGTAVAAVRRRRRMTAEVIVPINNLLTTIDRLRDGDLSARNPSSGVRELDAIGVALAGMASSLDEARTEGAAREARLAALAGQFETVVRVGREIAGSLSVRYVAAAVTSAAADLLDAPAVLWVRAEDQLFHAVSRSTDPHGAVPPPDLTPAEVVAVAAADARPVVDGSRRAYPLVLAGMVVGVLETGDPVVASVVASAVDKDTEQVLQALLSTAAAALESAHLHSASRELAEIDALTALPNRRRFEADIEQEWDRCRRYGRPMSVVMVDLDHFKELNDTNGHLYGDEVLHGAARAMSDVLRTSDTAYRYGGEEFVVLLRETALDDALAVAERLRAAIEHVSLHGRSGVVTASAGVAERTSTMAHHTELVAKADVALYEAKSAGRNRVVEAVHAAG